MIVIVVFLPILSLEAVEGKMFKPLAYTVMLALGGSIVFALVVAPVLASFLLNEKPYKESRFFRRHERRATESCWPVRSERRPSYSLCRGRAVDSALFQPSDKSERSLFRCWKKGRS